MPRLSNDRYLERHYFLKKDWIEFEELYCVLTVSEQWDLHAFYQPSKVLKDEDLLYHRQLISKERPSLPAQTGKSFRLMSDICRRAYQYANGDDMKFRKAIASLTPSRAATDYDNGKHSFRITAIANPEPDYKQLARALIAVAEAQARQKEEAA
jgi:hypothetical protein